MEERGVAPPFPLLAGTPPPSSGVPAKIHPFPRGGWFVRRPCRLAHTQKKGGGVCYHSLDRQGRRAVSEEGAAARLKKSDFVNKKSPSARGVGETVTLRARGMGASCILVYSSHFLLYIISYEKEKFRSRMLNID